MIATKISMPVTPFKESQEVVERLKAVGIPQSIIEQAEHQEHLRTDLVREAFSRACAKIEWLEYAHTFEQEVEVMYLKGKPNRTKGVERVLARLKERGVITSYAQVEV